MGFSYIPRKHCSQHVTMTLKLCRTVSTDRESSKSLRKLWCSTVQSLLYLPRKTIQNWLGLGNLALAHCSRLTEIDDLNSPCLHGLLLYRWRSMARALQTGQWLPVNMASALMRSCWSKESAFIANLLL
jgi:hypothetical protein